MYIYKAGVVGLGKMGAEIAQVITYAGLPVVGKDINEELVSQGLKTIKVIYERRVRRGKMAAPEMEERMKLFKGTTGYDEFADVDIVIEAVPEDMELKKRIFKELEEACPKATILATNTSALSISELGRATNKPEKVIGMHFFFPAHVMKLVEVIPGQDTSQETIDDVVSFSEDLRKIPVKVKECPGFLVNRLLMPYLNEAAYCLQEGAATPEEIDKEMTEFGFPMGPLTLLDNLGLDIAYHVAEIMHAGYGDRMPAAQILKQVYQAGRYGKRTRAGIYNYKGEEDRWLEDTAAKIQKETGVSSTKFSKERLLYLMVNEAALCLEESIATASDVEKALLAGIGFPQAIGGILRYADQEGIDKILEKLERWKDELGRRFQPAPLLKRMVEAGHTGKQAERGFFEYI